ncbi:hypothetical protein [Tropicimonas isoalkanivorans]|uniref:Uncharacterized protein n=1 Tax=Tropicimonas isoalkanivorans TaxID=441112 RepID=A0A1I1IHH9_9RHOB|nr:hypothetical protein [Tropicimonas isoalkanivorans]SFC35655.1 hypothetical protein SAMN04488094_10492 [Tropicimonas isoalkanivorans]
MSLNEIAHRALEEIKRIEGIGVTDGHEAEILAAIDKAMHGAMEICSRENADIVEQHLSHATGAAERINEEADRRRTLLVANLSALR